MLELSKRFTRPAVIAAFGLTTLAGGATVASAQDWGWARSHTEYRCAGDRCATYRCDPDGDMCRRISGWTYRNVYRGYRYGYSYRTEQRCSEDSCATFRCDADGDNCVRISAWRDRY